MKVDVAASAGEAHPGEPPRGADAVTATGSRWSPASFAVAGVVAVGVALRFAAPAHLWLDEALTVNIAKLPLDQLRAALERDGAPPLFYVLLHAWTAVFGSSDVAVRALSGTIACVAVGLAYLAGRRLGRTPTEQRRLATAAMVVVATSPYAIRYASEARMYSLVVALGFAGIILVCDVWRKASRVRVFGLGVVTAGLLYSQYWSFFLLAAAAVLFAVVALRGHGTERAGAGRVLAGLAVGCVMFLPWIPTLRTQLAHTGTPWDAPAQLFGSTWHSVVAFGGGRVAEGWLLSGILMVLVAVGVFSDREALTRSARVVASVGAATLVLGVLVSAASGNGVQDRYVSVVFPFVALASAVGIVALPDRRARGAVLAVVACLGLVGGVRATRSVRTASGPIARAVVAGIVPGDVVAYCPDQLGPSTARLLDPRVDQVTFPSLARPEFVDWTDYADRNAAASPTRFATRVDGRAGTQRVWLVWSPGFRTLGRKCESVVNALSAAGRHGTKVTVAAGPNGERVELRRFDR